MRFDIISLFPEMFSGLFAGGILKKALAKGRLEVAVHDLREFATGRHRQADDRPFGGLEGMVLKPEPVFKAVETVLRPGGGVFLLSAGGRRFTSAVAREMAGRPQAVLICGRYEGVDERVAGHLADDELSIGDYVLTGGELAAMVIVDAVSRFVPGVVGKEESVRRDSFAEDLLDFPQYTRPREFRGLAVPEVLFSGDHGRIERWRRARALEKTLRARPDLLERAALSPADRALLDEIRKTVRKERKDA